MLSWVSRISSPAKDVFVLQMFSYLRILLPRTQPTFPSRPEAKHGAIADIIIELQSISGSPKSPDGESGIL